MTFLQDRELRLRAVEPEDLDYIYLWENDPEVWEHGAVRVPVSQHAVRQYIANSAASLYKDGELRLIIERTDDKAVVGCIDLTGFDEYARRAEVSLLIDAAHRHKGYAARALKMLQDYAFGVLNVRLIYALIAASNRPCIELFDRFGFTRAATLLRWTEDGDVVVYTLENSGGAG